MYGLYIHHKITGLKPLQILLCFYLKHFLKWICLKLRGLMYLCLCQAPQYHNSWSSFSSALSPETVTSSDSLH